MENTNEKTIVIKVPDYTNAVNEANEAVRVHNERTAAVRAKNVITTGSIKEQMCAYLGTLVAPLLSMRDFAEVQGEGGEDFLGVHLYRLVDRNGFRGVRVVATLNCIGNGSVPYYTIDGKAVTMTVEFYTDGNRNIWFSREENEALATMIRTGRWPAIKETASNWVSRAIDRTVMAARSAQTEAENYDAIFSTFTV